jgi:hypothetical protein
MRKSDNDAQNKNDEKYESNRKQLFLSSWATDRPWLQNDDEKGMTCKICVEQQSHHRCLKKLISDKMSMRFSLSVREINSIKQVAAVILS